MFTLTNLANLNKRVIWKAASTYDRNKMPRRMSSDQVIAGPTHRQVFPADETDREVSMSGIVDYATFRKLEHLYSLGDTEFQFSDGDWVWEVEILEFAGRRQASSILANYTMTLGVLRVLKYPQAPTFGVPAEPSLIVWPELSPVIPDGIETVFTTIGGKEYEPGQVAIMHNGRFLEPETEFAEVSSTSVQFLITVPSLDVDDIPDSVMFMYITKGSQPQLVWNELMGGAVNGVNTVFTTQGGKKYYADRLMVLRDGRIQVPDVHYSQNVDRQSVTWMGTPPDAPERVTSFYMRDLSDGVLATSILTGNIVWPVQSSTSVGTGTRIFSLPSSQVYRNRKVLTARNGLVLVPGVGAVQVPGLSSVQVAQGDVPDTGESIMFMFEPV